MWTWWVMRSSRAPVSGWRRCSGRSIPHDWHRRNALGRYEGYWASVFYSHFAAAGLDVAVEDSTSHGRLDMVVRFRGSVYLFEFKVVETAPEGAAMDQSPARALPPAARAR